MFGTFSETGFLNILQEHFSFQSDASELRIPALCSLHSVNFTLQSAIQNVSIKKN